MQACRERGMKRTTAGLWQGGHGNGDNPTRFWASRDLRGCRWRWIWRRRARELKGFASAFPPFLTALLSRRGERIFAVQIPPGFDILVVL